MQLLLLITVTMSFFWVGALGQNVNSITPQQGHGDPAAGEKSSGGPLDPNAPNNGVPPGFEEVLPKNIIQQLRNLHANTNLTFAKKREKFNDILDTVSGDILAKLPPPPGFELLPPDLKEKINQIHTNVSLTWKQKNQDVAQLIASLPEKNRAGLAPLSHKNLNFPLTPPPGFENVLPKEVYQALLKIHTDPQLEPKEKIAKINRIMRSQPKEILDKLPLPPGFEKLQPALLQKARAIISNTSLDYDKAIIRFIKSLPEDQRALVRSPLPSALDKLPQDVKEEIDTVFLNEELDEEQRNVQFWKIIEALPKDQRSQILEELNGFQGPPSSGDNYSQQV